jgi:AcrR family transcriptional regulator
MKKVDKTQLLLENKDLLDAVIKEFAYKSYQEASINEIIKNASYNKGSFYYRFKNKQELFVALLDHVIVEQISLFKDNNLPFSRIFKIEEMLFDLFNNLVNLYNLSHELYFVLTRHQYDELSKKIIDEQCLSPLINRFFIQFKRFSYLSHYENMLLVIENLYYNFPQSILKSSNPSVYLRKLVGYLVASYSSETSTSIEISVEEFVPKTNLTYIISDNKQVKFNPEFIVLSSSFKLFDNIKNILKSKNNMIFYNYKRIIKKSINYSIKDYSLYQIFMSKSVVSAVKRSKFFEVFLLSLFYYLMSEKPVLVIDHLINSISAEEKTLFLDDILPIIAKTSKIIIIDEEFASLIPDSSIYYLDYSSNLNQLDINIIAKQLKDKNYLYTYSKNSYHYLKILSEKELSESNLKELIIDNAFISIKRALSISYDEIIKSEDLYEKTS